MRRMVMSLLFCLTCTFLASVFVALSTFSYPAHPCEHHDALLKKGLMFAENWGPHQMALIVPFRDRFDELMVFLPHMHQFLNRQKIRHKIYIINQVDQLRFNRGSLINVGHLLSRAECDYLAMHDVDLLPLNPNLSYAYPKNGPFHVASPKLHPKYHYSTFVGGILLLTRQHYEKVNGLSNKYWGWGLEDDEFYSRLKEAKLNISRPENITTGQHHTFKHIHDRSTRKRDTARLFHQREATRKRDRVTGLHTVKYNVASTKRIMVDDAPATIYNVKLICDYSFTPWCDYKAPTTQKGVT